MRPRAATTTPPSTSRRPSRRSPGLPATSRPRAARRWASARGLWSPSGCKAEMALIRTIQPCRNIEHSFSIPHKQRSVNEPVRCEIPSFFLGYPWLALPTRHEQLLTRPPLARGLVTIQGGEGTKAVAPKEARRTI